MLKHSILQPVLEQYVLTLEGQGEISRAEEVNQQGGAGIRRRRMEQEEEGIRKRRDEEEGEGLGGGGRKASSLFQRSFAKCYRSLLAASGLSLCVLQ